MFGPADYTESDALVGYLDAQLASLRAAAYGLTDEQARATPCRSALSVGGLIKHATYVLGNRERHREDPEAMPDEAGFAVFMGSFALADDETLDGALEAFDAARATYLADVAAADPGGVWSVPPAPWDGLFTSTPANERYVLLHHIEELARHAGHADIIREQLDGADAAALLMAMEGRAGNDFVQPWAPRV